MFLPYFIALFLGLVSPSETSNYHSNTETVNTSSNGDPEDGGPGLDDDGTGGTGGGTGGGSTGGTGSTGGGVGGGGTGGETGSIPPPNP